MGDAGDPVRVLVRPPGPWQLDKRSSLHDKAGPPFGPCKAGWQPQEKIIAQRPQAAAGGAGGPAAGSSILVTRAAVWNGPCEALFRARVPGRKARVKPAPVWNGPCEALFKFPVRGQRS